MSYSAQILVPTFHYKQSWIVLPGLACKDEGSSADVDRQCDPPQQDGTQVGTHQMHPESCIFYANDRGKRSMLLIIKRLADIQRTGFGVAIVNSGQFPSVNYKLWMNSLLLR